MRPGAKGSEAASMAEDNKGKEDHTRIYDTTDLPGRHDYDGTTARQGHEERRHDANE